MTDSEPTVKITLTTTYEKLDRLEKQVQNDFTEIKLGLQEVQLMVRTFAEHEGRIRTLEEWRWKQAGVAAILGSIPAAFFAYLISKLLG